MSPDLIGALVDKGIMLLAGIVLIHLGYSSSNPRFQRFRKLFKIGGPLLVAIALGLIVQALMTRQ